VGLAEVVFYVFQTFLYSISLLVFSKQFQPLIVLQFGLLFSKMLLVKVPFCLCKQLQPFVKV
jgi:hypothetical protein